LKASHQQAIEASSANAASLQARAAESPSAEWRDLRPEAAAQLQLKNEIDNKNNQNGALATQLKQSASKPIQLFRAAPGTAEAGGNVPITLDADTFVKKHVATDDADAVTKTQARIDDSNAPQSMAEGTLANSLATQADWIAAMDADTTVLPPTDSWGPGIDYTEDDSGRAVNLGPIAVDGWEAQGTSGSITATSRRISKYVAGDWKVESDDSESDEEESKSDSGSDAAPNVSLTIDHLTQ